MRGAGSGIPAWQPTTPGASRRGSMSKCIDVPGCWQPAEGRPEPERTRKDLMETMASDLIQTYTDDNFDGSVLKAATPVVVDFWAEWCGPCRALGPAIDALAQDYQGKVAVGKLNVDDNPSTTMRYMVRGIPAVLL